MTHPRDIEYIRTMLPNISQDIIEKQKILQPGNCVLALVQHLNYQ